MLELSAMRSQGGNSMRNVTEYSDKELQVLIDNHRRLKATDRVVYSEAVEEMHRRHSDMLSLKTSVAYLHQAAGRKEFVTYGELAEANGCSWNQVRYPMNTHLWVLVDHAKRQGWPMLSAMIVNKANKITGSMDPETLKGFITAAKTLGFEIISEESFLKEQQDACFVWGQQSLT